MTHPMTVNSANQFIGSRISLISKADIRYEGVLYALDLQDSTISLAKVRSYGTEDRPTERPIPMKDEIYQFIIFRGSDIKSIDVLEPPKSGSTMACGLPQDPAIIEVSHFQQRSSMGGHSGHQNCGMDQYSSMRYSSTRGGGAGEGVFEGLLRGGNNGGGNNGGRHLGRRTSQETGTQADRRNGGRNNRNSDGRRSRQDDNYHRGPSGRGGSRGGQGNTPNRNQSNRGGGGGGDRDQGSRGTSGNRSQNRQRGIIQAQLPPKVTFEDPFDFEKSNEELKTAMEKLKINDEEKKDADADSDNEDKKDEPLIYYDKDKFFDNISCEALERTKGKPHRQDWRAERKLNAETFGLAWNPNQNRNGTRNNARGRSNSRDGYRGNNNQMRYNNYNRYNNRNNYGTRGQQQRNDYD